MSTIETPRLRLWKPMGLPLHWVVEEEDTGKLFMFPTIHHGYEKRIPFRGHLQSLRETPGYCYLGSGIPLRREWKEVCMDRSGRN